MNALNFPGVNGQEEERDSGDTLKKKKLKLSYESYRNMSNLLVMHMRREEGKMEEEGSETAGLRKSAVVNWYLDEVSGDIESEAELIEKKMLVEKVLDRLTYHVSVIMLFQV